MERAGVNAAFWRHFATAQLITGLACAAKGAFWMWRDPWAEWWEIPAGAALGFVFPIPLVAAIVGGKVLLDKHFPRKQPVRTNVLGAVLVGLAICALVVLIGLAAR